MCFAVNEKPGTWICSLRKNLYFLQLLTGILFLSENSARKGPSGTFENILIALIFKGAEYVLTH